MTLCVVCSSTGAKPRHTAGGACYGATCDGQCEAVAWEAHWQRVTDTTPRRVASPAWTQHPKEIRKTHPD